MSYISLGVLASRSEPGSIGGVLAVFKYTVGDPLTSYTFSRASSASFTDITGSLVRVSTDIARDSHFVGSSRTLLLEPSRTNQINWSDNVGNWQIQGAVVASPTLTSISGSDPENKPAILRRINLPVVAGVGAYSNVYQNLFASEAPGFFSVYLKGNAGAETPYLFSRTNSGLYSETQLTLTTSWANYSVMTLNSPTNETPMIGVDLRDGAQSSTSAMSFFGYGRQFEVGTYQTSLIHTVGSPVTRAPETLSLTIPGGAGQVGTLYEHYYDLFSQSFIETVSPLTTTTTYSPTIGRAWISWKFALGTQTLGTMQGV